MIPDATVQIAIKSLLDVGLAANGITNAIVVQSYNITSQGAPLNPVVLFTKILARRYGFQGAKYLHVPDPGPPPLGPGEYTKTEVWYEKPTYQINALITQDPVDVASLTAYDVVALCAAILQTVETRATLLALGIGIERIMDIRNPHAGDDSDRFVEEPSFDFVLSYKQTLVSTVPSATVEGVVISVP